MRTALLFPGQGAQRAGMGELVATHRPDLMAALEAELGAEPFERLDEGTDVVQPALYCAGLASWRALQDQGVEADVFAGHSLGEITALAAAETIDARYGLELVMLRGRLIAAEAERQGNGGMLAVIGGELADVQQLAVRHRVYLANDNSPGQAVLSGEKPSLELASEEGRELGLRTLALDVHGAFHSPAMQGAVPQFKQHLDTLSFDQRKPVYSCLTAAPFENFRTQLADAITGMVRWRELLQRLYADGVRTFIDAGPGRVMRGLVKHTLADDVTILTTKELGL
ncbi:MAG TPA: ACP S-malonyltransferase [Solirubrobacteraceae bacterium]|nr:ACP S-malonyltransferase [Solirubrobacteraceae bacterium]